MTKEELIKSIDGYYKHSHDNYYTRHIFEYSMYSYFAVYDTGFVFHYGGMEISILMEDLKSIKFVKLDNRKTKMLIEYNDIDLISITFC